MKLLRLLSILSLLALIVVSGIFTLPNYFGEPKDVSIIPLITNSWFFHGRKVRTRGFLKLDFEDYNLHLDKESYQQGLFNYVWLNLDRRQIAEYKPLDMHYVVVEGIFDVTIGGGRSFRGIGSFRKVIQLHGIKSVKSPSPR